MSLSQCARICRVRGLVHVPNQGASSRVSICASGQLRQRLTVRRNLVTKFDPDVVFFVFGSDHYAGFHLN